MFVNYGIEGILLRKEINCITSIEVITMKKNPHMCSVCFNLDDRVKQDMQEALSKTPYSMEKAFQIFAKMCSHAKNNPKRYS